MGITGSTGDALGRSLKALRYLVDRSLAEVWLEAGVGKRERVRVAELIFRPFEQRSSDRSGLGLGLAICPQSVEANGGELSVRDLPGKGCVFTISLPLAPPSPAVG